MRIGVIGSKGQLGHDLTRVLRDARHSVVAFDHSDIEVTDPASVADALGEARPEVVVNCAAFVRVDDAEIHAEDAFRVNAVGALNVARASADIGAVCVYISTDFVFDGARPEPYLEHDAERPINVYGASKLAGEHLTRQACPDSLIVRVSSLFGVAGSNGKGGNFIETILARARSGEPLSVVNDVTMSPTHTLDAAIAVEALIRRRVPGIVHVVNAGVCTWYEFAREAVRLEGLSDEIEPVNSDQYPTRARRPRNSSLASSTLENVLGQPLPAWRDALLAYLKIKAATRGPMPGA